MKPVCYIPNVIFVKKLIIYEQCLVLQSDPQRHILMVWGYELSEWGIEHFKLREISWGLDSKVVPVLTCVIII